MKIDKDVFTIIIIVVVSAIALPFMINGGYGFIINYIPGTMYIDAPGVWVGFYGGFLGASITLIGIYWQISRGEKHRHIGVINNTHAALTLLDDEAEKLKSRALGIGMEDPLIISGKYNREMIHNYIEKSLPEEKVGLIINEGVLNEMTGIFGKGKLEDGYFVEDINNEKNSKFLTTISKSFAKKIKNKKNAFEKKYGKYLNLEQKENASINI